MRIVSVADTHMFEGHLDPVPEGDVFVHAGDLVRAGRLAELEPVADWIARLPHRHKIVVAGNHDWCFARQREAALALLPGVLYLEDAGCVVEGVRFWGSPWQPAFNDWAFNLPRGEALAARWALIPADTDVLVTHGPPWGFGDRVSPDVRTGCEDLLAAVARVRPPLHLFGHIHEDGGAWRDGGTAFVNVTAWEGWRKATVLDFDPVSRAVTEVEIPPRRRRP